MKQIYKIISVRRDKVPHNSFSTEGDVAVAYTTNVAEVYKTLTESTVWDVRVFTYPEMIEIVKATLALTMSDAI